MNSTNWLRSRCVPFNTVNHRVNTDWFLWSIYDRINGHPPYNYFRIRWWISDWLVSQLFGFFTSYSVHFMNEKVFCALIPADACWRVKDRCIFRNSPLLHTTISTIQSSAIGFFFNGSKQLRVCGSIITHIKMYSNPHEVLAKQTLK